jgi:hypothetical protein
MSAAFESDMSVRAQHDEAHVRRSTNSAVMRETEDVIGSIRFHLARFFSTSLIQVQVFASRSRQSSLELSSTVTVKDDHDIAVSQQNLRRSNLELFLSTGARRIVILRMSYTCGEGHEPAQNTSSCRPCSLNHYKGSLGNELCVACPPGAVSQENTSLEAFSVEVCRCAPGSRPSTSLTNGSEPSLNISSSYWTGKLDCMTGLEEATVEQVSGVLTDIVASIVAIQIASTVIWPAFLLALTLLESD